MPSFADVLTDEQLSDLLRYLRTRFSDKPQWTDVAKDIRNARTGARRVAVHPGHAASRASADTSQKEKP